ncbi:uncharacterized protein [Halyomorpha halys]|uniref:uncharacterized protein n=1 Tax=Halyomorpha halys TaxID=286706 RepID=UPI000D0C81FA|nr:eukaryotic translation initiation factor 5B-like [Halyomorpha halys]
MDTGIETGIEWNTSEISASTSVFDITQNQSGELNNTAMSQIAFGNSQNSVLYRTVPTQESNIADTLAAGEHEESAHENITSSGKTATSNRTKLKNRKSVLPNESYLSETSEDSINYSAIQSAALLPMVHQIISGIGETSCNSESQLNTTYLTSQNSSLVSNSSSTQTVGELNPSLISSTQSAKGKNERNKTLPTLPEEDTKKKLNVLPKEVAKKRAPKGAPKSKSKGTQVNLKSKAPKNNVDPKKTTRKKVISKKLQEKTKVEQKEKTEQENKEDEQQSMVEQILESIRETMAENNNLNVNMGDNLDDQIKYKVALVNQKIEEFLNMPGPSQAVPDNNSTIGTTVGSIDQSIDSSDLDQSGSEVLVSQSCSVEITKKANRASNINIVLPPEANLSLSKKNPATVKKKSLPSNKVKNDSITTQSNTPKQDKIKIKQEKISPETVDLTSRSQPSKIKEDMNNKKKHSRKSETSNTENKKHGKASPAPKTKKQTIACGYMSSDSSSESDSYDGSEDHSSSCSCSDCGSYCRCSSCNSSSCTCSGCCSDSSYESPPRRRRYHR